MRCRERADAAFETIREFIEIAGAAAGEREDRQHIGERVFDPVVQFAGQGIADRMLFFKERQPRLILVGLLGQQPGKQHQQACQREAEHQCHHG